MTLREAVIDRSLSLEVYQDNQATARIMTTGRAPTLRRIKRTPSVSISGLNEKVLGPDITLHDCISEVMAAYIFTKHFVNWHKWGQVCMLIGICTNTQMSKLKPFKPCSPACVAVAHTAPSPAMSGAASSTDVNAFSAKAGTVTPTTGGTITDAPSAKAGAVAVNRWTSTTPRILPRPDIEDLSDDFVPLSAFPTVGPPSAKAEVLTAVAGEGFAVAKSLASLLALTRFFDPTGMLEARAATPQTLHQMLADALTRFHLRNRTTGCFTKSGQISTDAGSICDTMPGNAARKDVTKGRLSSGLQLARAVDLPPNLRVLLRADSTLTVYPMPELEEGMGNTKRIIKQELL